MVRRGTSSSGGRFTDVLLGLERVQGRDSSYRQLPRVLRVAITFVIVLFTWVFFRADDLPRALQYCSTMLGMGESEQSAGLLGGVIYQTVFTYCRCLRRAALSGCVRKPGTSPGDSHGHAWLWWE